MWVEVERLAVQENLTILLTTHYLEEADRLAERVAIVSRGKVVVEGTPEELKAGLHGESVTVELDDTDTRAHEAAAVVRAVDGDERGHRRGTPSPRARPERRPGDPRDPLDTREPRLPGRRGHDRPAVARRRLSPLHRPRVQGRGRGGEGLMQTVRQTGWMVVRQGRNLMREPIWIAMMIIQPLLWLLLYGQLFSKVTPLHAGDRQLHRVPDAGDHLHERLLRRLVVGDGDDLRPRPPRDRPLPRGAGVAAGDHPLAGRPRRGHGDHPGDHPAVDRLPARRARARRRARGPRRVRGRVPPGERLRRLLARHRPAPAPRVVDDRDRELRQPAADVPVVDPHRRRAHARAGSGRSRASTRSTGASRRRATPSSSTARGDETAVYLLLLLAATAATSAFATWSFRAYQRSI